MKRCAALLLPLVLASCATLRSPEATRIQEADAARVASCEFLSDLHFISGYGGLTSVWAAREAHEAILQQAAQKGATHIVWNPSARLFFPSTSGKAYRCGK